MTLHDDTMNTEIKSEHEEKTAPSEEKAAAATEARPIVLHNHPERDNHTPTTSELANSVSRFVSENPGPSVLIGAGLAWLFVNRERSKSRALPTRLKEKAVHAKDATGSTLSHAAEATSEKVGEARTATSARLESAKLRVQTTYNTMRQDNPLALGACALAAGLAIGLLLPSTRREDELMGEHRDSLLDQAKRIVEEARDAAVATLRSSRSDVEARLEETKEEVKDAVKDSIDEAKQAAAEEYRSE